MKEHSVLKKVIQAVFVVSLPFFTLMELHSGAGKLGYVISLILTVMIAVGISGRVTESLLEEPKKGCLIVAAAAALYISYCYAWQGNGVNILNSYQHIWGALVPIEVTSKRLVAGLILASTPSVFMLVYWIIKKVWPYVLQFLKSLDRFERSYLGIILLGATVGVTFFYLNTAVCYHTVEGGTTQLYDVLYTTDCTEIYISDCFLRILSAPNDIRQPLFGLFALPVALVGKLVAAVFFFVPNAYAIALGIEQFLLEGITVVMLLRMMKLEKRDRIWFALMASGSYAYLIHGLMIEQYAIAYFYVILVLYVYQKSDKQNFAYFGAVSTLLTSGILFGLISKTRDFKKWMLEMLKCLGIYMGIVVICGQLPQFLGIQQKMEMLRSFSGEAIGWSEKWVQFSHFVQNIFWAPVGQLQNAGFSSYRAVKGEEIAWFGVLLLILVLCGFWVSRQEWISRIAMFWVLFSVLILFGVGWGTAENGLILYALYFAWAYLVLLYQLIQKVFKKPVLRGAVVGVMTFLMVGRGLYEIVQIYQFGIAYYPAL